MFYLINLLLWILTSVENPPKKSVDCITGYKDLALCYPLKVKDAVKKHQLEFKPPGYYFKNLLDSSRIVIYYKYEPGDFDNEHQSEFVLQDRDVHTYAINMPDRLGLFDEELRKLELLAGREMTVTRQTCLVTKMMSAIAIDKLPNKGTFVLAEGLTKDSIHVFLREVPRLSPKQKPQLEVIFSKGIEARERHLITHSL